MESLEKIFESNWGSVFMIYDSKKNKPFGD